jgi:hypothetical protein
MVTLIGPLPVGEPILQEAAAQVSGSAKRLSGRWRATVDRAGLNYSCAVPAGAVIAFVAVLLIGVVANGSMLECDF